MRLASIALLVQALRALKQENVTDNELQTINSLISKEPNQRQCPLRGYGLSKTGLQISRS